MFHLMSVDCCEGWENGDCRQTAGRRATHSGVDSCCWLSFAWRTCDLWLSTQEVLPNVRALLWRHCFQGILIPLDVLTQLLSVDCELIACRWWTSCHVVSFSELPTLDSFSKAPLRATLTLFWGGSRSFLIFVNFDMSFSKNNFTRFHLSDLIKKWYVIGRWVFI